MIEIFVMIIIPFVKLQEKGMHQMIDKIMFEYVFHYLNSLGMGYIIGILQQKKIPT